MKAFIIVLSCVTVCGADEGTQVFTSTRHTSSGDTSITETYVRDGQTNLIRITDMPLKGDVFRSHQLFHNGQFLAVFVTGANSSGCITEPASQYILSFSSGPTNELLAIIVGDQKGKVVDAFGCTNGIISPVSSSMIREAKGVNMRQYMVPENIRRRVWKEPYSGH